MNAMERAVTLKQSPKTSRIELVDSPANPMPATGMVQEVVTSDGISLRAARWLPAVDGGRGTVCLLLGRGEFIEKHYETVQDLRQRGFHVVSFDWRGQGGSQRFVGSRGIYKRGHVPAFAGYHRDLDAVFDQVIRRHCPSPFFALGHSMAGALLLQRAAVTDRQNEFARIVAVSPMIGLSPGISPLLSSRPLASLAISLVRIASAVGLGRLYIPGGKGRPSVMRPFERNRLTSDKARFLRAAAVVEYAPWIGTGDATIGWLTQARKLMNDLQTPDFARRITTPVLVVVSGGDTVVSTPVTERFCARLKAGNALVIPGARHEILLENDDIRAMFFAAFDAFIPGSA